MPQTIKSSAKPCEMGELQCNLPLNRYPNVLPCEGNTCYSSTSHHTITSIIIMILFLDDFNRVKLFVDDHEFTSDYINANFVDVSKK